MDPGNRVLQPFPYAAGPRPSDALCFALPGSARVSEQRPRLAVFLEVFADCVSLSATEGVNVKVQAAGECFDGDDVPDVFMDNGGKEIDLLGSVWNGSVPGSAMGSHEEAIVAGDRTCLDLYAPRADASIYDNVVALVLAVGFGHGEAFLGGFQDELQFGQFSFVLGVVLFLRSRFGHRRFSLWCPTFPQIAPRSFVAITRWFCHVLSLPGCWFILRWPAETKKGARPSKALRHCFCPIFLEYQIEGVNPPHFATLYFHPNE